MPLVKTHLLDNWRVERKRLLNEKIHDSLVAVLGIREDDYFHRIFVFNKDDLVFPETKSSDFIILEIHIFPGRTDSQKAAVYEQVYTSLSTMGIKSSDVFIQLIEQPNINWGFNGKPRIED